MKKSSAFIVMLVDKSGSMSLIKQGAIDGFNNFVKAQLEIKDDSLATVCLFDSEYLYIVDKQPLKDVALLDNYNYIPKGSTALNDALGSTINKVSQQIVSMPEKKRPSKVIVCIISDGEENASQEYTQEQIKSLIEYRKEHFKWEFVFIGTNQDIVKTRKAYSFDAKATFAFNATSKGVQEGYDMMSCYVTNVRSSSK